MLCQRQKKKKNASEGEKYSAGALYKQEWKRI